MICPSNHCVFLIVLEIGAAIKRICCVGVGRYSLATSMNNLELKPYLFLFSLLENRIGPSSNAFMSLNKRTKHLLLSLPCLERYRIQVGHQKNIKIKFFLLSIAILAILTANNRNFLHFQSRNFKKLR